MSVTYLDLIICFEFLFAFAVVLLVDSVLTALVAMRMNMNVSNVVPVANIATAAGPKMEIGASAQEVDCRRVVVPTIVGGWKTLLCPFALAAVGIVVLTSLAVFVAWRMYQNHTRTRYLEEEEGPLRDLEEIDFEESDFEESESEESEVEESEESESEESDIEESESEESDIEESYFVESDFKESDVEESDVEESDFEESDFEESDYEESESEESDVEESESEESDFEESDAEESKFVDSDVEESDILVAEEDLKEENALLRKKLRDPVNIIDDVDTLVKEKEDEKELTNVCDKQMEDMARQIEDLLAKEEKMNKYHDVLEEKLKDTYYLVVEIERRLELTEAEKLDILRLYDYQLEEKDHQIHDLMAKEEKLKIDHWILEEKLECALSKMEDMERLLKEKEDEKIELVNLHEEQVQNLLANEEALRKDNELLKEKLREALGNMENMIAIENKMKEADEVLAGKLQEALCNIEVMETVLKEKERENTELTNHCQTRIENKDHQMQVLSAKKEKLEKGKKLLEEKLEEAHNSIQEMESLLEIEVKEKRDVISLYNKMVENNDHQIRDMLANEDKLKTDKTLLEKKLEESADRMQDLESLLKEKEEEKTEMTSLYDKMIATRDQQIKDLLAKEDKLKEEQEILQVKLGKALSCVKEEQDFKIKIEKQWLLEISEKNRELDMLRKLCEEYDERQRHLEEKLGEVLNEVQQLGLSLKKAEDSLTETSSLVKEKEEALIKVRTRCEEQDMELERLRQQATHLQGKLQKKGVDYESLSFQRNKLETLLNTEKELLRDKEREITDLKIRCQQILVEKEQQEKSLLEENDYLQKEVASLQVGQVIAMSNEEKLKSELKFAEEKVLNFMMAEEQKLHTIEKLTKECELLKEKCRTLEGSMAKAEKCAREQQRMQEEALRIQDKYMLMGLLHRIAQRDFELERIAREEHEITEAEGEKPLTENEDLGHEDNQEFSNAQDDNRGYLRRQWLDVTNIVEDILYRDERPPEEERDVEPNH